MISALHLKKRPLSSLYTHEFFHCVGIAGER